MKFQFYNEKLIDSLEYQKFRKEHPDAYPCSAFFAIDIENKGKNDKVHFDYWIPEFKKMYSFKVSGQVEFVNVENFETKDYEKLSMNYDFDLKNVQQEIMDRMEKDEIKGTVQKLLFSLQKTKGVDYLLGTIFLNNMAMLKVTYSIADKKIVDIVKKSFLDMFKIIKK